MRDLPFFKFHPNVWLAGDIQICSFKAQGLFVNICAIYWTKECSMSLSFLINKFPDTDNLLFELTEEGVLTIDDNNKISIDFLDEQYGKIKRNPSKMKRTIFPKKGGTSSPLYKTKTKTKIKTKRNVIPPKLEWVVEYCEKRKREGKPPIDPEQFFNNYKAKGWLISGGVKMKNWEAAVRYWEGNQRQRVRPQNTVGSRRGGSSKKQYRKPDIEA